MTTIEITTEYIKLQDLLKFAAIASTGGEAKLMVQDGQVRVNDDVQVEDRHYTVSYADQ